MLSEPMEDGTPGRQLVDTTVSLIDLPYSLPSTSYTPEELMRSLQDDHEAPRPKCCFVDPDKIFNYLSTTVRQSKFWGASEVCELLKKFSGSYKILLSTNWFARAYKSASDIYAQDEVLGKYALVRDAINSLEECSINFSDESSNEAKSHVESDICEDNLPFVGTNEAVLLGFSNEDVLNVFPESKENLDAEFDKSPESEIERKAKVDECSYECHVICNNNLLENARGCHVADKHISERRRTHPTERLQSIIVRLNSKRSISEPVEVISEKSVEQEQSCSSGRPKKDRSCPFCLEVFASMQCRKRHIIRRHPDRANDELVNLHMWNCVPSKEQPFICDTCHKIFSNVSSLHSHCKSIHQGIKNFICEVCKKAFVRACELRKHVKRVHERYLVFSDSIEI